MKVLYFDCFSGISGDMTLGALLDLDIDKNLFLEELNKINVDGFSISIDRANKNGIDATNVHVILEHKHHHSHQHNSIQEHEHHHEHIHRNLNDINQIIDSSKISEEAKILAKKIFMRVAIAEAAVHGKSLEDIHFHEVGALDSIVDIIGTAILITLLKPDKILSSPVNDGYGFTHCQHGQIPVPVPATVEIFKSSNALTRQIDVEMELVTPTGAAIISELAQDFGSKPQMKILQTGYGAGKRNADHPNVLRVLLGEVIEKEKEDSILILEANLDDCSGEILGYTMERLFETGVRDAYYTPVFMKKNRPGVLLTVILDHEKLDQITELLFLETTTIGIRYLESQRVCLPRKIETCQTSFGKLDIKVVELNGKKMAYPEYESAKKLAKENHVPLKEIYQAFHYHK